MPFPISSFTPLTSQKRSASPINTQTDSIPSSKKLCERVVDKSAQNSPQSETQSINHKTYQQIQSLDNDTLLKGYQKTQNAILQIEKKLVLCSKEHQNKNSNLFEKNNYLKILRLLGQLKGSRTLLIEEHNKRQQKNLSHSSNSLNCIHEALADMASNHAFYQKIDKKELTKN